MGEESEREREGRGILAIDIAGLDWILYYIYVDVRDCPEIP
jgi:hypothetical protein